MIIGEVVTCEKHPNADKLSLTTVNVGSGTILSIVCGAPNVKAGQKVVVAPVGTTLYGNEGAFKIKPTKIRGVLSEGMICAEDEIGLGTNHEGIIELPTDAPVGGVVSEYFGLERDEIIEVDITPNRIDGASHIGIARDLAAFLRQTDESIKVSWPSVESFKQDSDAYPVTITIENHDACTRYSGVTVSGVKVEESPGWLKKRLLSIGLTPVNNVVDITNFVLHECGQPLHAFDGEQVKGNRVHVKTLPAGTTFTTLDGKERQLDENDLMICNEDEAMCIAGVYGGIKSGVSPKTSSVFLESACFSPVYTRRTSRRHGLFTDASFRFERGSDPNITVYALKRAALLIKEIAGGEISSPIIDINPSPVTDCRVALSQKNLRRLLGKELELPVIKSILTSLEIKIESENGDILNLAIPPYRVDVKREVDVIEEILRIYGFNSIEAPEKVNSTLTWSPKPNKTAIKSNLSTLLTGAGFYEICCNSLTKAAYHDGIKHFPGESTVMIANPLSTDLNGLRQTLLFGGLETIRHNRNRQNPDLMLFEFGNCYGTANNSEKHKLDSYHETEKLALFMTGKIWKDNWSTKAREASFTDLKNHCSNILSRIGFKEDDFKVIDLNSDVFSAGLEFHEDGLAPLLIGIVDIKILKQFDINEPLFFAEMDINRLIESASLKTLRFSEIPRFPEVRRDLSLLIDKSVRFADLESVAKQAEKRFLKQVNLFDIYVGDKIESGKKSYAISLILEDRSKTLTEEQIAKSMNTLIQAFEKQLGAKLR